MPQLRSFSSLAATPNIAQATLGGINAGQQAIDSAVEAQLKRQQINAQLAQAEMESSAQKAALQQRALIAAQELEVNKFINQQRIGLASRELDLDEQKINEAVNESLRKQQAQRQFQQMVEADLVSGMTPQEAFSRATSKLGPQVGFEGGAYGAMARIGDEEESLEAPTMQQMEGEGAEDYLTARTGPKSWQVFKKDSGMPEPQIAEWDPSLVTVGRRTFVRPQEKQALRLDKEIEKLESKIDGRDYEAHRAAKAKASDPDKTLTIGEKRRVNEYDAAIQKLDELKRKAEGLRSSLTNTPARATSGGSRKVGRFEIIEE